MKRIFSLVFTFLLALAGILFLPHIISEDELPASFVRDTMVRTSSGLVRIEDIKPGDRVYSYQPLQDNWLESEVLEVSSFFYDIMAITTVTVNSENIVSSGHHPYYVMEGDNLRERKIPVPGLKRRGPGWIQAADLEIGDRLLTQNGELVEVDAISTEFTSSLLYDLEVTEGRSFTVGENDLLVGDITLVPTELYSPTGDSSFFDNYGCFPQGTLVGGETPIEDIRRGDTVLSYNLISRTWQEKPVLDTFIHSYKGTVVTLTLEEESLEATANHPFYVLAGENLHLRKRPADLPLHETVSSHQARWVEGGDLVPGDILLTRNGPSPVLSVEREEKSLTVYNIQVAQNSSYTVGNSRILVHNKGAMEGEMVMESSSEYKYSPPPMDDIYYDELDYSEDYIIEETITLDSEINVEEPISDLGTDPVENDKKSSEAQRETPEKLYLSADDSNSCASPVITRNIINNGRYVHPSQVRTYEFYNYYSFGYPAPQEGDLGVFANMHHQEENVYSVQAVLRSPDRTMEDLPKLNVVFLMDSSGSMAGDSWNTSRFFVSRFVDFLRPGDSFAVVSVDRYARVLMEPYQVNDGAVAALDQVLEPVIPDDITNLDPGIAEAYRLAEEMRRQGGITRVVFISDGGANAGDFSGQTVSGYASDGEEQGIYLTGVGVGSGFNDGLMDMLTDSGRGAYFFLDNTREVEHIFDQFLSYFDLAYKDVRLAMQMPPGWSVKSFHGEQISTVKEDIVPQYLAPNDQMIFHMELAYQGEQVPDEGIFTFQAEYTPLGSAPKLAEQSFTVSAMLDSSPQLQKADVITLFAEGLKQVLYPLDEFHQQNIELWKGVIGSMAETQESLQDKELDQLMELANLYYIILDKGEQFPDSADLYRWDIPATLGIESENLMEISTEGPEVQQAIRSLDKLGSSVRLQPTEGYRFLGLSSGPIWNPDPIGSGSLSYEPVEHPEMDHMGWARYYMNSSRVFDLHSITLKLKAPDWARSFSFDLNYFSAEYPDFVNQNYNDSFYAILEAASTNQGAPTNISFDPDQNPLEVDNNYFQRRFHPIPNHGTGFDRNGSTGWLRTSWPIEGGEEFTLTFTIHDEGDSIYDSLVLLDNFQWQAFKAAGNTDPLN